MAVVGLLTQRVVQREKRDGNEVKAWGMMGYVGEQCGGVEYGTRHDGAIVRLSGFSAQAWWKRFGKLATNCSRIDLQRTAVYDREWSKTLSAHWREMRKWHLSGKRRPKPKAYYGPRGPETIYSGSRTSDTFLRLYHRGSKPGLEHCAGHIRYECELKDCRARVYLDHLLRAAHPDNEIAGTCSAMFKARGCRLEWLHAPVTPISVPTRQSDNRRRLAWLKTAVRPSVLTLIEAGLGEEVLESLGLVQH